LDKKIILLFLIIFIFGWICNTVYSLYFSNQYINLLNKDNNLVSESFFIKQKPIELNKHLENNSILPNSPLMSGILNDTYRDIPSPYDWIKEEQIKVYNDQIIIKLKDAKWATFTNTKSMDPVIDRKSNAIEIVPKSEEDIHVGDIVSYKSRYIQGVVIHRVIKKEKDKYGTYFIMKGDNNPYSDPEKVRFNQIKRVLVIIIY
jgi:c-di-AMP phosphodiesterase-like protein